MTTQPTQATGTSPFQGKGGGTGTGLSNAFLNNQALSAPPVTTQYAAPTLGSISGGLQLMPMPATVAPTPTPTPVVAPAGAQKLQRGQFIPAGMENINGKPVIFTTASHRVGGR